MTRKMVVNLIEEILALQFYVQLYGNRAAEIARSL